MESYLDQPLGGRPVKSAEARAKVREALLALRADVVALQEMGSTNALLELRASLAAEGLAYPHWEHVTGHDTNIHVAVLSRFPIIARHPHTNDSLREIIADRLKASPEANLLVLGDFNDTKDSSSVRTLIGRGRLALVDTRPSERNGDDHPNPNPRFEPRQVAWTHYYGKEDTYSRIDYILLSPGLAREWDQRQTYVLALPNWGTASDHRPIVAGFFAEDR